MPSSVIATFSYDPASARLRIVFNSGMIYEYIDVPEEVYNEMKNSGAKGIFLNRNIKGRYKFEKVK
jgi:hypothetical protein